MLTAVAVAWLALFTAMRSAITAASWEILIWAVAFRLVALWAAPVMEDDYHRFLWDGYRFNATGNPYAEPPSARFADASIPAAFRETLDHINHPDVPTIYGPVCEWAFRICHVVAPARLWPWKLGLLGSELALCALLWPTLDGRGRSLLSWCPLAVFETGFNAHPDALAIVLLVASWRMAAAKRVTLAGIAAGLAVAAKIFSLLLIPFLLWRLGRRAWTAAAATAALFYAPFWLQGSSADLAGLHAMASEWEFNSSIYALVASLTLPASARALCAAAFAAIWYSLWCRNASSARSDLPPGEWIYGCFLLLSATANPWYCLWLWPFVAARISSAGLCALAAPSLAYVTGLNLGDATLGNFEHPAWLRPVEFGAIAVALVFTARRTRARLHRESTR